VVCLRNISVDTLHKRDTEHNDDDDDDDNDDDNNNNDNNKNNFMSMVFKERPVPFYYFL
jgi:hypothetical protein